MSHAVCQRPTLHTLRSGLVVAFAMNAALVPMNAALVPMNAALVPMNAALLPMNAALVPMNAALVPMNTALVPMNAALVAMNTALVARQWQNRMRKISFSPEKVLSQFNFRSFSFYFEKKLLLQTRTHH